MTYLALTHGATGIICYMYKDIKSSYDAEVRWSAVKSIGQEIKDISPILLAKNAVANSIVGDNPLIHWKAKEKNGKIFLIAVNSSVDVQSIVMKLPVAIRKATFHVGLGMAYPQKKEMCNRPGKYRQVSGPELAE